MIWNLKTITTAIIAAIIALAIGGAVGYYKGDAAGYKRHKTEIELLAAQRVKAAQKKIAENTRNRAIVEREIDDAPKDVACGALTDAFIKRVR